MLFCCTWPARCVVIFFVRFFFCVLFGCYNASFVIVLLLWLIKMKRTILAGSCLGILLGATLLFFIDIIDCFSFCMIAQIYVCKSKKNVTTCWIKCFGHVYRLIDRQLFCSFRKAVFSDVSRETSLDLHKKSLLCCSVKMSIFLLKNTRLVGSVEMHSKTTTL